MKKLILALLLTASTSAFSMSEDALREEVRCINGYNYLYVWSATGDTVTVVQMYQSISQAVPPQPARCEMKL